MSPPQAAEVDADHRRRALGLEFGYFYNAIGTKVTLVELLDRSCPGRTRRSPRPPQEPDPAWDGRSTRSRRPARLRRASGVKARSRLRRLEDRRGRYDARLDRRRRQRRGSLRRGAGGRDVQGPHQGRPLNGYQTTSPGVYAVGDVIGPPWLAHVAHHEAVYCVERSAATPTTRSTTRTSPAAPTPTPGSPAWA